MGMIKEHGLNIELSKEVFQNCSHCVRPKECYNNVFNVLSYHSERFRTGEWKVAYGYVNIIKDQPMMARHCFIVTSDGEAIDPTIISTSTFKEDDEKRYMSFKVFDSMEDYLDSIESNNNNPFLFNHPSEDHAIEWAKTNNKFLIG
jgi:hypothetical protein